MIVDTLVHLYGWADEVAGHYPDVGDPHQNGTQRTILFRAGADGGHAQRNVYVDVVGTSPAHLRQAIDAIGSDRIMFGSD